ncbi:hypothetical protein [Streptomyces sp. Ncost-T10-10d]|uniref:hypothetical protein n=1 Tax=Streptomyces sp. Ncost-T10-10d TaxID=1839774 RepID=UPI00081EB76B|nr:hypothetical protein [Streptomyces sp. Ncost-T10-10d]SCF72843.1 hypothetical protein GA0115254_11398 [Streptomyces sp. Ncost-T10-10d]
MKTITDRLHPARWDTWYREGRAMDRLVTDAEADRFLQHVNLPAGAPVLGVGHGIGSLGRQLFHWGYDLLGPGLVVGRSSSESTVHLHALTAQ